MDSTPTDLLSLLETRQPRFVTDLLDESRPEVLAEVVDGWNEHDSAWAQNEAARYLLGMPNQPGHEVVVRRLILAADRQRRYRVLAAAMVFADQLVVRDVRFYRNGSLRHRGNRDGVWLSRRHDTVARVLPADHPARDRVIRMSRQQKSRKRLFSLATRQHLRRFVWRSIRKIAKESPDEFIETLALALRRYPDSATNPGHRLLECWCLMKALFGNQDDVFSTSRNVQLLGETTCDDLINTNRQPPYHERWMSDAGMSQLVRLSTEAQSDFVRRWAVTRWAANRMSGSLPHDDPTM